MNEEQMSEMQMNKEQQNKFRPMPFWSWNDEIKPQKVAEQIGAMNDQRIGGFVIHARSGLKTEYMGKEWFSAVDAAINAAEAFGMNVWIYDENGWPSGFGNGTVNGLGVAYQQKYLRMGEAVSELRFRTASLLCACWTT